MKYRVLHDFRNGKTKYKKGGIVEMENAEEFVEAGVLVAFNPEEATETVESVQINEALQKENADLKIKNGELKEENRELKEENEKSKGQSQLVEMILTQENITKMEVSLIDEIAGFLGLDIVGDTKKEKANSLYEKVTE